MKKTIKVTAIILSVVTVLVTHPFLRINAMEINKRPIVMERIQNITNSSGQLIFDGSQISYNYSISNAQSTTLQGATILNQPVIYICDLVINLTEPVSAALITINFNTASTTNYPLNFIVEHGRVTSSNYNTMTVQALDTNIVYIKLIFSLQQINDNYSYPIQGTPLDPYENEWVQYGYQYFQIQSAKMTSATQYQGEYIPKLNSILASVDGLESLMQQIVTSNSNIDTNIQLINNTVNTISSKMDSLDNVDWVDLNATYLGYSSELSYNPSSLNTNGLVNNGTGYIYQQVTIMPTVTSYFPIFKVVFPAEFLNNYQNYEFGFVGSNNVLVNFDILMSRSTRGAVEIYFTADTPYYGIYNVKYCLKIVGNNITVNPSNYKGVYYLSENDANYWKIYGTIQQLNQLRNANNSLARIIQLLENMNINVTYQDVTNIVNNYDINIDQIFNVENNINTQLQQEMQNFTPDNTGILQRLNDSSILLKSVMNQINGIEIFAIPIAVTLVGIVLLAIVG